MKNHEQAFKAVYPRATIESHGSGGKRYYLVWTTRRAPMWSGCGDTKAQAWKDAASRLSVVLDPPATQAENDLINLCNHAISTDQKVMALRAHVTAEMERLALKEYPRI